MIFRQLFDHVSSTYTYLLADEATREAVLIDPVFERHVRDAALIRELDLKLLYTLDTHCHADHVTGAWLMKEALGSKAALAKAYDAANIDVPLVDGDVIRFGEEALEVRATPGHTDGCLSFVTSDRKMVFTGDALLVRGAGRTDFQAGDPALLYQSIKEQLFSLPDDCVVYPAHDYDGRTSSTIGEEKKFNARIGGDAREEDFVGYMMNLALPHPKQLDIAVPANMRGGRTEDGKLPAGAAWGPLVTTYAGVLEIRPEWVASHRADVTILDVRTPAELAGELGHLTDMQNIPLDELRARAGEVRSDKPVVCVCQTGRRSAIATQILSKAGITKVANLPGGMVAWRGHGLPS
jgi:glyoxylase-like metal-dependent hydrolase (beta-lactamase superfamily II)/rhodanese-related sulfurtransferase